LSFGDQAIVRSPASLRHAVLSELRRAIHNYDQPTRPSKSS
jgi:predicted DNA-binding transcriptional regulator YafY